MAPKYRIGTGLSIPNIATTAIVIHIVLASSLIAAPNSYSGAPKTTYNGKVYVHMMPWFETNETYNGTWGIHWTMANKNPDLIVDPETGRREIAAHCYPEIGPYASGNPDVIDYQLLLMKYSGIDGVLIDWSTTVQANTWPLNIRNAEAIIEGTERVGLEFAIVYEDHNIQVAYDAGFIDNKINAALQDMSYIQQNYFSKPNYVRINGFPLLMDFGPQTFKLEVEWTIIFTVLTAVNRPVFVPLGFHSDAAGANAAGEFGWVWEKHLDDLEWFYEQSLKANHTITFGAAYPGFHSFYEEGGWDGPFWSILDYNNSFSDTLSMTEDYGLDFIQLTTWNDYGEGTMIEPTLEFGTTFLEELQTKFGVVYGGRELQLIKDLYMERKVLRNSVDKVRLDELSRVFRALVALDPNKAEGIMNEFRNRRLRTS